MNNGRALIMFVIALLAGLAAVVSVSRWLIQTSSDSVTQVSVAAADIGPGQPISVPMVKTVNWPKDSLPAGTFADPKALEGRVVRTSLSRGEPVLEAKLAPAGTKGGLSAMIDAGHRAITVRVNDVVGVAGFALPGNYVDVIVNTQAPESKNTNNQSISKIVLERILVLAVAQEVSRDETQPKVVNAVTLEVTPDQAEKLDLARSVGTLSLVLRNQIDNDKLSTDGATKLTLLGAPPVPASAPAAPHPVPVKYVARPAVKRDCIGVLSGVAGSQECF
ncbi:Flp pilus assembly protein CpaB [Paraburkholderia dinghuensis]|uniref:Flp pilus assembly protein CpaB n=1 Tax=Paraburkholderia dinghuensis TaxID=2305225 RepID=A0A3N6NB32_9BURK|nr:Flp pilus assembly protein CpaB [Paraburkholderia dinghuensis]RQH08381.1 Flp pilus assembly protein CpaB [Paraburkholderia dinghuensis]